MGFNITTQLNDILERFIVSIPIDNLNKQNFEPAILNLEKLGEEAGKNDFFGLQDACLITQEFYSDLLIKFNYIDEKQHKSLMQWCVLIKNYINHKGLSDVDALIDYFSRNKLSCFSNKISLNILRDMLIKNISNNEIKYENDSSFIDGDTVLLESNINYLENNDFFEIDILNKKLEDLIEGNTGDIIEFYDVYLLIQENINELKNSKEKLSKKQKEIIIASLRKIELYLNNKDNNTIIFELIDILKSKTWPLPITDSDANIIVSMFYSSNLPNTSSSKLSSAKKNGNDITKRISILHEKTQLIPKITTKKDIDKIDSNITSNESTVVNINIINILISAITSLKENAQEIIDNKSLNAKDKHQIKKLLSLYFVNLEKIANACKEAELYGLYESCILFNENLNSFIEKDIKINLRIKNLLLNFPHIILQYLKEPENESLCNKLVGILQDKNLPKKLMQCSVIGLVNLLKIVRISYKETKQEKRKTIATKEDVSIELPENINMELLYGFLQELPEQTESLSDFIKDLVDGDILAIQKAQHIAHTIKGAANTVGIKGIAELTHQLENILSSLSNFNCLPPPQLSITLVNASYCLESMSEALSNKTPTPVQSQEILQSILDWANEIELNSVNYFKPKEKVIAKPGLSNINRVNDNKEKVDYEAAPLLRVPVYIVDKILRLTGENMILTSQLNEKINQSSQHTQKVIENQNILKDMAYELESIVEVNKHNQKPSYETVLKKYNEIRAITNNIIKTSVDSYKYNQDISKSFHEVNEIIINKKRSHNEIQDLIFYARMVPVKTIIGKLELSVRQTCYLTKKLASLKVYGENTMIDSNVLNDLTDILMNILRNSVDHGIEIPEKRVKNGKIPKGNIKLFFCREDNQILVRCEDDGVGLNIKKIINIANKRKIVEPNIKLTNKQINNLILEPGLSTRSKVTQTSGRGIGLNIVHTKILSLKGSVSIDSKEGEGFSIELRFPITLMSTNALLLEHFNQFIAISDKGIKKILSANDLDIMEDNKGEIYKNIDGDKYEVLNLEDLLKMTDEKQQNDFNHISAILIHEEELRCIVYTHKIVDSRKFFIQSVGKYLDKIKGLLGATILGDGGVIPVIDLPALIRSSKKYIY